MHQLLQVDLGAGKWETRDLSGYLSPYLGGLGINTRLALDLIPAGADPLGPENALIFGVGSLVGTLLPTASRTEATAKSPLSGRFGTSNAGGEWGAQLRYAGYHHLAILGKSAHPVYLVVDDDRIFLEDARHLWGLDVWQTVEQVRSEQGQEFQIASIGPAGEGLVRFACIMNNYYAAWGRTGLGAVMGAKNLKAIAVRGTGQGDVADPRGFLKVLREARRKVMGEDSFGFMNKYGSMVVSDPFNAINGLPGHNFTVGSFANWDETRGRKFFAQNYKKKDLACFSCPISCAHWSEVKEGELAGYGTKGLEVTFTLEFGAKLGITEIPSIFQCVDLCNRLGMDVVSASGVVAMAMEAGMQGLLDPVTTGIPERWGDFDGIYRLLDMIGARQGIGDLLALGTRAAARQIPGAADLAMHVRGVEMLQKDPRSKWDVWTLGYLTNIRGGDSLRTRSPVEAVLGKVKDHLWEALEVTEEYITRLDMPETVKEQVFSTPPQGVSIPHMAKYAEDLITVINSTGLCIRPPVLRSLGPDFFARALTAVTGVPFTAEEVIAAGERVWNLQHEFNLREGELREEYVFPERFYREELPGIKGVKPPLDRSNVEETLSEYFRARGWSWD
ncbi:MAG: aldehyde ferredoxin oxidoreductase family protein [Bacillota bacterium]